MFDNWLQRQYFCHCHSIRPILIGSINVIIDMRLLTSAGFWELFVALRCINVLLFVFIMHHRYSDLMLCRYNTVNLPQISHNRYQSDLALLNYTQYITLTVELWGVFRELFEVKWYKEWSAVITRANIAWYCQHNCADWSRIWIDLKPQKPPYISP